MVPQMSDGVFLQIKYNVLRGIDILPLWNLISGFENPIAKI